MYGKYFSIENIPFGIASSQSHPGHAAVTRIRDEVIFLDILARAGFFQEDPEIPASVFDQPSLNAFARLGRSASRRVREILQQHFRSGSTYVAPPGAVESAEQVTLHLPVQPQDFTDFAWSKNHMLNSHEIAKGSKIGLPPGYQHMPLGYTGRCSSIVPSGTPVRRPLGQYRSKRNHSVVEFGESRDIDYELELGCIIGKDIPFGDVVTADEADDHIFGFVLLNDWTARDILALEIFPLGPLNGKGFQTSMSPWVVTLDALEPFKAPLHDPPKRDIFPYLKESSPEGTYAIKLKAEILGQSVSTTICEVDTEDIYWTARQLVAHQAIGACGLRSGDIIGTGTCSGRTPDSVGSLFEKTMNGQVRFTLADGSERGYLENGDVLRISGFAGEESDGVGFGECIGEVLPSSQIKF